MLNRTSPQACALISLLTVLSATKPCNAIDAASFAEFTTSINTATFRSIKTFGLFARSQMTPGEIVYGGLRFNHYELINGVDSSELYQIVIGASTTGNFAPFMEIGTDLINLFASRENLDCANTDQCRINAFIRAGLRLRLPEHYTLGIFHESMTFDNFSTTLTGDHHYTGISLGLEF